MVKNILSKVFKCNLFIMLTNGVKAHNNFSQKANDYYFIIIYSAVDFLSDFISGALKKYF